MNSLETPEGAILVFEGRAYTITAEGALVSTEAFFQIDAWTQTDVPAAIPWHGAQGLSGIVMDTLIDFARKARTHAQNTAPRTVRLTCAGMADRHYANLEAALPDAVTFARANPHTPVIAEMDGEAYQLYGFEGEEPSWWLCASSSPDGDQEQERTS